MADVRSMLKQERASRRINHQQASYSASGQLLCLVCQLHLKSDVLWEPHLKSFQHTKQLQRHRDANHVKTVEDAVPAVKKRKVVAEEEQGSRKRSKAEEAKGMPADFFDGAAVEAEVEVSQSPNEELLVPLDNHAADERTRPADSPLLDHAFSTPTSDPPAPQRLPATDAVDEAEWAAFERDVATPPPEQAAMAVLNAAATIEAAPISAADLAARAREEQSTQRGRREAELEAEKEDAARHLEEEFDEMDALEERVRTLREKREALRKPLHGQGVKVTAAQAMTVVDAGEEDAIDEDDDEDEWEDAWRIKTGRGRA